MSLMKGAQLARVCFAEYVKQTGSFAEVAAFCRVQPQAVLSWQDERWPRGESLYRLWAFLEFRGYRISELEQLPNPSHQLLLIVASGQLSFEDVRVELKYQNLQDVYRLFRHGSGLTKDRAWRMEELVLRHLGSLKAYRRTLVTDVTSDSVAKVVDVAVEPDVTATNQLRSSDSSLARLMRLVVRRSSELGPDELRSQLKDVPREELEAFALLLLELV